MKFLTDVRRMIMLTCEDVNQFLAEYLDDALPPEVRRRFEKHVGGCDKCTTYLDQYRRTIGLTKEEGAAPVEPPDELVEMTLAFLREHIDRRNGAREG